MAEDECLETWEDLEDSGELDKRLENIEVQKVKNEKKSSSSNQAANPLREETNRSTYQPQVRILKRNTNSSDQLSQRQDTAGQQNKGRWRPLEEREAAYAEARMRIFGQAEPPPADEETPAPELYGNSELSKQIQTMKVSNSVDIVRQPKGPDGSKGFAHR